jgi:hypothetical protein
MRFFSPSLYPRRYLPAVCSFRMLGHIEAKGPSEDKPFRRIPGQVQNRGNRSRRPLLKWYCAFGPSRLSKEHGTAIHRQSGSDLNYFYSKSFLASCLCFASHDL